MRIVARRALRQAAGITAFTSEAVLALLGSVLAALLLRTCRPMIAEIQREFTR